MVIGNNVESVMDFYAGKSVFITGASGFVGQVIVEKLLSTCKDVDKIYVLMRAKRNKTSSQRHSEIVNNPLFANIKKERPDDLKKIIPVLGDIVSPKLGLSIEDEQELIDKVAVVIHSAATIRFTEPLNVALDINLEGTRKILDLCKKMKILKTLVYISTAYSQPVLDVTHEKLYPPPADLEEIYKILDEGPLTDEREATIIKGFPNTYTFSKAMTEPFIAANKGHVPVVIIRPSIVGASVGGSAPGWLTNWAGCTGVMTSNALGLTWVFYAENENISDVVPVDYVANITLVAGAKHRGEDIAIYVSCISGHGIQNHEMVKLFLRFWRKYGLDTVTVYPFFYVSKNPYVHAIADYLQCIPTYLADLWLKLNGQKTKYVKAQNAAVAQRAVSNYFIGRQWHFTRDRAIELYESLSDSERSAFPFDPSQIDFVSYYDTYVQGVKKYLFKK